MSYTTVYLIRSSGDLEEIVELQNAHGFAPYVWSVLCKRYLGAAAAWCTEEDAEKLWALGYDKKVPRAWRAALLCTYDFALIEHNRFCEVAGLLREFSKDTYSVSCVCHFSEIVRLLEQHASDTDVIGMCFYPSSISDNLWFEYDGAEGEDRPYDVKAGTKHFFVGETLDKTDGEPFK
jgi:hypothetical protein